MIKMTKNPIKSHSIQTSLNYKNWSQDLGVKTYISKFTIVVINSSLICDETL